MEPNQAIQAGTAERQAASAAIQQQDAAASGARGDTRSSQLPPVQQGSSRDIEFNPANEPASGVASQAGSQLGGASGVAGIQGGQQQQSQSSPGASDEWESLMDSARGLGYDFGEQQFNDDRQFLLHLLNQSHANRQADYYAQVGRQIAPHLQSFQQYLGQQQGFQGQQQRQGVPQQQQRPEWEPPEFDREWLQLVDQDPRSGRYLAKPGVNPVIADRVNEFDRWQQKYGQNPVAPVRAMMQHELPGLIQSQVAQAIQQYQHQQTVNSIVDRNSEWMYQRDASGRVAMGVGGVPIPTPQGMRYGQLVQQLERSGMRDPNQVDQFARNLLMGELAQGQLRSGQQQVDPAQQRNGLASSRTQTNQLQSLPASQRQVTPGATEPDATGISLTEMLRANLAEFSDADFRDIDRFR